MACGPVRSRRLDLGHVARLAGSRHVGAVHGAACSRQPQFSFWLPTASNDDLRDKRDKSFVGVLGAAWARDSGGQGLFLMAETSVDGLDVLAQVRHVLA